MLNPHFPYYFEGFRSINENGNIVAGPFNEPVTVDKIVINHYHCKSWEEYQVKHYRGYAPCLIFNEQHYSQELFESHDRNEVFDDGILKYREARAKVYQPPDTSHVEERMLSALERNLSQQTNDLETLLTCRAVSTYLKAKSFEEASLKAIIRAFNSPVEVADNELFSQELSELSKLPYPVFG